MLRLLNLTIFILLLLQVHPAYGDKLSTIVALGDSTTAGTPGFFSPAEAPPLGKGNEKSQYAYWIIEQHPEWRIFNRGINGERTDQILNRFDSDVLPYKPDIVVVLAGVNDLYQGLDARYVTENLKKIYDRARKNQIKVLACTILPYNGMTSDVLEEMKSVNKWIRSYAQENELGYCDTFQTVNNPNDYGTLIDSPDGLHPTVEGYQKMGYAIGDALEKQLQESSSSRARQNPNFDQGQIGEVGGRGGL